MPACGRAMARSGSGGVWTGPEALHLAQTFVRANDDPVAVWNRGRDHVLEALDHPGTLQTEARSPWGHPTVDAFLGFAF